MNGDLCVPLTLRFFINLTKFKQIRTDEHVWLTNIQKWYPHHTPHRRKHDNNEHR